MSSREASEREAGRRTAGLVHIAMLASILLYVGLLLWFVRPPAAGAAARPGLSSILLAIGLAEYIGVTVLGKRLLMAAAGRAGALERVRRYFLIRFAAAEAIAVFGLLAGFRGEPAADSLILFAFSAMALLASAPTRTAWVKAARLTSP